jgi:predicted Rossmann fold nucleotide-binding protein DprA/Smf involved in DNA uptake
MLKTSLISGSVILIFLYIGFGDKVAVLPENMRNTSTQARTTLVEFGGKLVPNWVTKTKDNRGNMLDQAPESTK